MTFQIKGNLAAKLAECRDSMGLKDNTATINFVLQDYFERANGKAFQVAVETAKSVRSNLETLLNILLVMGSANIKTKEALASAFPHFFNIESEDSNAENG